MSTFCLPANIGYYPKSKLDGNFFIGISENSQATRIALRAVAGELEYHNARGSPTVIFMVTCQMSLMFLRNISNTSEHMNALRNIAIQQTSMEVMIAPSKYDGKGCYIHWKNGYLIPMHFSKKDNHMSLYTDSKINPLQLEPPIWWALMMSMLGIFNEQLSSYEGALKAFNIELNQDAFLKYIYDKYHTYVEGNLIVEKIKTPQMKNSMITLEPFEQGEEIFEFADHGRCSAKVWYSRTEVDTYVSTRGCLYCRHLPEPGQLVRVSFEDSNIKLRNMIAQATPLRVKTEMLAPRVSVPAPMQGQMPRHRPASAASTVSVASSVVASTNPSKGVIVMMRGTVGCGKSSFSRILMKQVREMKFFKSGQQFSPDDHNKKAPQGSKPNGVNIVRNELRAFINKEGPLFGIIDTCGELYDESNPQKFCFDTSLRDFNVVVVYPNFIESDMKGYLSFSLYNVLKRAMHSPTTDFYLNPVSAGFETCKRVHTDKARALFKHKFFNVSNATNLADAIRQLEPEYLRYQGSLQSVEACVADFIAKNISI